MTLRNTRSASLLMVVLCLAALPAWAQQSSDRQIAAVYADEALQLYRDAEHEAARTVARRGLEFAADNSDLHALIGLTLRPLAERTHEALDAFEHAFRHKRFSRIEEADAAAEYAGLLNRITQHARALSLIEALDIDTMLHPDLLYQEARALLGLGRIQAAEERASTGIRIYLHDPRFFRLMLERQTVAGYRDWLAVRRYQQQSSDFLQLLLTYAERAPATPQRREVVEQYFAAGGRDPLASLLLLYDGEQQQRELERFLELGGDREHDLLQRAFAALEPQLQQTLVERMADFDGELIVDRDRNAVAEQRLEFQRGALVRWQIDAAQDGVVEYDIEFDGAVPRRVEHRGADGFCSLEYGYYPEVRSIRFEDQGNRWSVYYPIGDRLEILLLDPDSYAPTDGSEQEQIPMALRPLSLYPEGLIIDRDAVQRNAAYVEVYDEDADQPYRVVELLDGVALRSVTDHSRDGAVDHVVVYSDGKPIEGMRDLLGSGRFDVLEYYRDGRLQRLAVKSEPGAVAQFYQEFNEIEVLTWDFDRDGNPDVEERYFQDELILRRYASGGDGVFDLPIDFLSDILDTRDD
ncbi:MAG: hypothetical protein EA404_05925 [Spirochaetaceae bacterium]|nr:MAG: hypothetical protein EA404_05925 [Spirochaetaceae bacterium]